MLTKQPTKKKVSQTFVSNFTLRWIQKALKLIPFSLVVNHLANRDSFFNSESYRFPI
ncbi:hypothetical protein [Tenacibaculum sp. C7A-26P2]|uniref:hypothetical protein n=1 Tax=Tenacibaculum sp. C7A-26P2 TaxID=3447504 RepID=UPI003F835271